MMKLVTNWGGGEIMILRTCPNCKTEAENDDAAYCFACGTFLINFCSDKNCLLNDSEETVELPPHHDYCYECGAKTSFGQIRLSD